jgi:hypothetical protein
MSDYLLSKAVLGRMIQDFLGEDIGNYLLARAQQDEQSALERLTHIHPWRHRAISKAQGDVRNARNFQVWLADAITEGVEATKLLSGEE